MGSRLSKGSDKWEDPSILVNVTHHAAGNPRLFIGPDRALWLLAPVNYGHWCQGGTRLFLKRSYDNGFSWTDLELFIERKGILGKNKPLQLQSDRNVWLIPAEFEKTWISTFIRTGNNGEKWEIVGEIGKKENVRLHQPTVVELDNGSLLAYMRSWEGYIYKTRSSDNGKTWDAAEPTSLLNNNSGIDMVRLKSGILILAFNPRGLGKSGDTVVDQTLKKTRADEYTVNNLCLQDDLQIGNIAGKGNVQKQEVSEIYPQWGPRTPLSLAVSGDDGESWTIKMDLETEDGEFSYPAIIQGVNRRIHVVYTYNRTYIKYVSFYEEELVD